MSITFAEHIELRAQFQPKHGTAERWNDCNCHDCRTNRVGHTLNIEEVVDAAQDGVDIRHLKKVWPHGYLHYGGRWYEPASRTVVVSGMTPDSEPGNFCAVDDAGGAALDRVREYWRRRALAEMKAAEVARHLTAALAAAHEHAQLFAKIADDGVLPVDRAQKFRSDAADLAHPIREIERLHNSYKVHGDVP